MRTVQYKYRCLDKGARTFTSATTTVSFILMLDFTFFHFDVTFDIVAYEGTCMFVCLAVSFQVGHFHADCLAWRRCPQLEL